VLLFATLPEFSYLFLPVKEKEIPIAKSSHRETAESFLTLAASGKVREAYGKHVDQKFPHYNPFFRGDRESLMLAMEENARKNPDKTLEIKRTLEDGDPRCHLLPCATKPRRPRRGCGSYFPF
jgi:hypothetical protein